MSFFLWCVKSITPYGLNYPLDNFETSAPQFRDLAKVSWIIHQRGYGVGKEYRDEVNVTRTPQ